MCNVKCANIESVLKQVSVVLCDWDPLGGMLLICSLCGENRAHTKLAQLENREIKKNTNRARNRLIIGCFPLSCKRKSKQNKTKYSFLVADLPIFYLSSLIYKNASSQRIVNGIF